MPPLGRIKVVRWDRLAYDDADWDESKVKRDHGKFAKQAGSGGTKEKEAKEPKEEAPEPSKKQHPKMAEAAYPINPIKSALTKAGFVKGKGKQNYTFTHPNGEQIEIHAANEGQKWLTGWTHGEHTGKGPTSLAKYLANLAGKPKTTAEVKQEIKAAAEEPPDAWVTPHIVPPKEEPKAAEPPPVPAAPASASSGGHWDIPWPGEEPKKEPPKEPEKNYPKGIQPAFHNALEYNGFTYTNSEWDGKIYKKPDDGVVVKVYEVAKPKETSPADINWTVSTTKGFEKDEATVHGTGMAGMLNGIIKAKDKHQAEVGTPAAAKEIGVPPDLKHLWPHKTESAGWEYYHDDPDNETQEVAIGQNGDWQIWKKGEGSTSGNGQATLNAALQSHFGAETKPSAPTEPTKIGLTSGVQKLLPHAEKITDMTTVYADKNINSGEQTEELTVNESGYWSIWQKDKGIVAEGSGGIQEINTEFEKLHPRDEHGHFIKVGGEAEAAAEPLTDQEEKDMHPSLGVHDFLHKQGFKPTGVGGGNNPNHYYQNDKGAMIGISAQEVGGDYEWVYSNANGEGEKGNGIDLLAQTLTSTGPIVGSSPEEQKQKIADLTSQLSGIMSGTLDSKGFEVVGASENSLLYQHPDVGASLKVTPEEGGAAWTLYDKDGKDVASGKGAGNLTESWYKHKHAAAKPAMAHPNQAMHDWLKNAGFEPHEDMGANINYKNAAGDVVAFAKTSTGAGYAWGYYPKNFAWKSGTGLSDFNTALQANKPAGATTTMAAGESVATPAAPAAKQPNPVSWYPDFKIPKKHWGYKYANMSKYGFQPTKNLKSSVLYEDGEGNKIYINKKLKKGAYQLEWQANLAKPGGGTSYEYGSGTQQLSQTIGKWAGVAPATPAAAPNGSLKSLADTLLKKVGWESQAFIGGASQATQAYSLPNDKKLYVSKTSPHWMILQGSQTLDNGAGADTLKAALQDHGALSGAAAATPEPPPPPEPTVPQVKAPEDISDVLGHQQDLSDGTVTHTDTDDPTKATEQVTFNPDGSWAIWNADGTMLEGKGQATFNQAFESLHPRGPDGKFAKKAGGEELAPKIKQSTEVSTFSPGATFPSELHGIEFKKWTPSGDWNDVEGQNHTLKEPPMDSTSGKKISAGVLIQEPDGRVWLAKPAGNYGGYEHTFPKGGVEAGHGLQVTAIKEAYEESGLKVEITGFAGDYAGETSLTRYYFAKRTGGSPVEFDKAETEKMVLVPPDQLDKYLNKARDKQIMKNHLLGEGAGKAAPAAIAGVSSSTAINFDKMKKVGEKLGSNPGGTYEDEDGKRYYVKTPKTAEHTKNELLAAALYKLVGGEGSTFNYQKGLVNGKLSVATDWEKLDKDNIKDLSPAERKAARRDFAIQAWLGNWDAAGIDNSNIGVLNGKVIPLDLGGALKYRAQGEPKTLKTDAPEWESLRNAGTNPNTAALYGDMTTGELQESANRLKAITNEMIRKAVMENPPADTMMRDALISTLQQRRDAIVNKATPKPKSPGEMRAMIAGWNPTQKPTEAVAHYKGSGYQPMNTLMRFFDNKKLHEVKPGTKNHENANRCTQIMDWLDKGEAQEELTLWRGVPWEGDNSYLDKVRKVAEPGLEIAEPGFMSMSTSEDFSRAWARQYSTGSDKGILYKIKVPKGAKIATVKSENSSDSEYEVLAQNGSYLKIISWTPNYAEVELVQGHL